MSWYFKQTGTWSYELGNAGGYVQFLHRELHWKGMDHGDLEVEVNPCATTHNSFTTVEYTRLK